MGEIHKIQFYRGSKEKMPAYLDVAKPAFTTDTYEMYVGTGDSVFKVGPLQLDELPIPSEKYDGIVVQYTGTDKVWENSIGTLRKNFFYTCKKVTYYNSWGRSIYTEWRWEKVNLGSNAMSDEHTDITGTTYHDDYSEFFRTPDNNLTRWAIKDTKSSYITINDDGIEIADPQKKRYGSYTWAALGSEWNTFKNWYCRPVENNWETGLYSYTSLFNTTEIRNYRTIDMSYVKSTGHHVYEKYYNYYPVSPYFEKWVGDGRGWQSIDDVFVDIESVKALPSDSTYDKNTEKKILRVPKLPTERTYYKVKNSTTTVRLSGVKDTSHVVNGDVLDLTWDGLSAIWNTAVTIDGTSGYVKDVLFTKTTPTDGSRKVIEYTDPSTSTVKVAWYDTTDSSKSSWGDVWRTGCPVVNGYEYYIIKDGGFINISESDAKKTFIKLSTSMDEFVATYGSSLINSDSFYLATESTELIPTKRYTGNSDIEMYSITQNGLYNSDGIRIATWAQINSNITYYISNYLVESTTGMAALYTHVDGSQEMIYYGSKTVYDYNTRLHYYDGFEIKEIGNVFSTYKYMYKVLTDAMKTAGWTVTEDGLKLGTTVVTWDTINDSKGGYDSMFTPSTEISTTSDTAKYFVHESGRIEYASTSKFIPDTPATNKIYRIYPPQSSKTTYYSLSEDYSDIYTITSLGIEDYEGYVIPWDTVNSNFEYYMSWMVEDDNGLAKVSTFDDGTQKLMYKTAIIVKYSAAPLLYHYYDETYYEIMTDTNGIYKVVTELPETPGNYLYKKLSKPIATKYYKLYNNKVSDGYELTASGIYDNNMGDLQYSWDDINNAQSTFLTSWFYEASDGTAVLYSDGLFRHISNTNINYNEEQLYYYNDVEERWIYVGEAVITTALGELPTFNIDNGVLYKTWHYTDATQKYAVKSSIPGLYFPQIVKGGIFDWMSRTIKVTWDEMNTDVNAAISSYFDANSSGAASLINGKLYYSTDTNRPITTEGIFSYNESSYTWTEVTSPFYTECDYLPTSNYSHDRIYKALNTNAADAYGEPVSSLVVAPNYQSSWTITQDGMLKSSGFTINWGVVNARKSIFLDASDPILKTVVYDPSLEAHMLSSGRIVYKSSLISDYNEANTRLYNRVRDVWNPLDKAIVGGYDKKSSLPSSDSQIVEDKFYRVNNGDVGIDCLFRFDVDSSYYGVSEDNVADASAADSTDYWGWININTGVDSFVSSASSYIKEIMADHMVRNSSGECGMTSAGKMFYYNTPNKDYKEGIYGRFNVKSSWGTASEEGVTVGTTLIPWDTININPLKYYAGFQSSSTGNIYMSNAGNYYYGGMPTQTGVGMRTYQWVDDGWRDVDSAIIDVTELPVGETVVQQNKIYRLCTFVTPIKRYKLSSAAVAGNKHYITKFGVYHPDATYRKSWSEISDIFDTSTYWQSVLVEDSMGAVATYADSDGNTKFCLYSCRPIESKKMYHNVNGTWYTVGEGGVEYIDVDELPTVTDSSVNENAIYRVSVKMAKRVYRRFSVKSSFASKYLVQDGGIYDVDNATLDTWASLVDDNKFMRKYYNVYYDDYAICDYVYDYTILEINESGDIMAYYNADSGSAEGVSFAKYCPDSLFYSITSTRLSYRVKKDSTGNKSWEMLESGVVLIAGDQSNIESYQKQGNTLYRCCKRNIYTFEETGSCNTSQATKLNYRLDTSDMVGTNYYATAFVLKNYQDTNPYTYWTFTATTMTGPDPTETSNVKTWTFGVISDDDANNLKYGTYSYELFEQHENSYGRFEYMDFSNTITAEPNFFLYQTSDGTWYLYPHVKVPITSPSDGESLYYKLYSYEEPTDSFTMILANNGNDGQGISDNVFDSVMTIVPDTDGNADSNHPCCENLNGILKLSASAISSSHTTSPDNYDKYTGICGRKPAGSSTYNGALIIESGHRGIYRGGFGSRLELHQENSALSGSWVLRAYASTSPYRWSFRGTTKGCLKITNNNNTAEEYNIPSCGVVSSATTVTAISYIGLFTLNAGGNLAAIYVGGSSATTCVVNGTSVSKSTSFTLGGYSISLSWAQHSQSNNSIKLTATCTTSAPMMLMGSGIGNGY